MKLFGSFCLAAILFVSLSILGPRLAFAAPEAGDARRVFTEARELCERDHGQLWGTSICGPIFLVDYTDHVVLANQADAEAKLKAAGKMFQGILPDEVIIANTPTEWSGTRWTQLIAPLPNEADKRHVLIAHELFHRIQPTLHLTRPEAPNHHLDTLKGRFLLQLEWRALARALQSSSADTRKEAIADVLAFRQERYRLFPDAAKEEGALETNEGTAEYTGVKLGLTTDAERIAYAVHDLSAFVAAPTFVRSFAYATGPAYGLLLDQAAPGWRKKIETGERFDQLLSAALKLPESSETIEQRTARYDDGTLRASEKKRDKERSTRLAVYKKRLVNGPVLSLPLKNTNYQFNPQTLVPLEGFGTVYPTMRLTDDWGSLEVERDGALVRDEGSLATVSATGADPSGLSGDGWTLKLNPGWKIEKDSRPGDLVARRSDATTP